MLSYQEPHLGQVMDLSAFLDRSYDSFQRLLAVAADQGPMTHHLIRAGELHQGLPRMSWLPSRLPLAPVTLAPQFSSWAITRRRFAAVLAILGKLPFHLSQAHQDGLHLLAQGGIFGSLCCQRCLDSGRLGSLSCQFHFQLRDTFFCYHGSILTASAIPDLSSYEICMASSSSFSPSSAFTRRAL